MLPVYTYSHFASLSAYPLSINDSVYFTSLLIEDRSNVCGKGRFMNLSKIVEKSENDLRFLTVPYGYLLSANGCKLFIFYPEMEKCEKIQ